MHGPSASPDASFSLASFPSQGILMGFSNGAGSMAGMIGPWVTGRILQRVPGEAGWHHACVVPAGLCTAGALVFAALGTGERLFD